MQQSREVEQYSIAQLSQTLVRTINNLCWAPVEKEKIQYDDPHHQQQYFIPSHDALSTVVSKINQNLSNWYDCSHFLPSIYEP
jgi:hypothetical protein